MWSRKILHCRCAICCRNRGNIRKNGIRFWRNVMRQILQRRWSQRYALIWSVDSSLHQNIMSGMSVELTVKSVSRICTRRFWSLWIRMRWLRSRRWSNYIFSITVVFPTVIWRSYMWISSQQRKNSRMYTINTAEIWNSLRLHRWKPDIWMTILRSFTGRSFLSAYWMRNWRIKRQKFYLYINYAAKTVGSQRHTSCIGS